MIISTSERCECVGHKEKKKNSDQADVDILVVAFDSFLENNACLTTARKKTNNSKRKHIFVSPKETSERNKANHLINELQYQVEIQQSAKKSGHHNSMHLPLIMFGTTTASQTSLKFPLATTTTTTYMCLQVDIPKSTVLC